jgi:hypothetical protein
VPRTAWRRTGAVLALALVPALSACSIGVNAGTTSQGPSGNGANANSTSGTINLRGVTIVTGPAGSTNANLLATVVNAGTEDDTLTGVTITAPGGATTTITGSGITGGQLPLPSQSSSRVGFNSTENIEIAGLTIAPTAFAQVQFTFAKAGNVSVPTMAVPPTGIYTGLGPVTG